MRILILGSLTIDIIEDKKVKGGPAFYSSLAAELLEVDYYCCGIKPREYCWETPRGRFIDSDGPLFEHKYINNVRISKLIEEPKKYDGKLPDLANFDVIFVNPVYREFEIGLLESIASRARTVVDVQGFVRLARNDRIEIATISKCELDAIENCWAVHISIDELSAFKVLPQKPLTAITFGEEGAKIRLGNTEYYIPAYRVKGDPTGAGDFFTLALITEYLKSRDLIRAGLYAASLTSIFVEGIIPRNITSVRGILKRIEPIIESRMRKLENEVRTC